MSQIFHLLLLETQLLPHDGGCFPFVVEQMLLFSCGHFESLSGTSLVLDGTVRVVHTEPSPVTFSTVCTKRVLRQRLSALWASTGALWAMLIGLCR